MYVIIINFTCFIFSNNAATGRFKMVCEAPVIFLVKGLYLSKEHEVS